MACKKCNDCADNGCAPLVYPDCILTKVAYPCIGLAAGKTGTVLFAAINTKFCGIDASISSINSSIAVINSSITTISNLIITINSSITDIETCLYDATGGCEIDNLQVDITEIGDCLYDASGNCEIDNLRTDITALEACVYDASGNCPTDGAWRLVGDVGEPAFGTVGLSTAVLGIGVSFRLNKEGKLALRGGFDTTADLSTGDVIFTLPAGYRPNAITVALAVIQDTAGFIQFEINTLGEVSLKGSLGVLIAQPATVRMPEYIISLD